MFGDNAQRQLLAGSANHEWRMRLSDRFRLAARLAHLIIPAVDRGFFRGPHALDDRNGFVEPANPFSYREKRNAVRVVLQLEPGGADSHYQTAGNDVIECGTHLRKDCGMSIVSAVHWPARLDLFRVGR